MCVCERSGSRRVISCVSLTAWVQLIGEQGIVCAATNSRAIVYEVTGPTGTSGINGTNKYTERR